MGQLVDIVRSSLPSPELLAVESMDERESKIIIRVQGKDTPRCPACAGSRVSYHSRYYRTLRDLPWQGRPVQIQLHIRRFRCRNADCRRKIFGICKGICGCFLLARETNDDDDEKKQKGMPHRVG